MGREGARVARRATFLIHRVVLIEAAGRTREALVGVPPERRATISRAARGRDGDDTLARAQHPGGVASAPLQRHGAAPGERMQFERTGYVSVDPDSGDDGLVFNRIVTLRDTWAAKS